MSKKLKNTNDDDPQKNEIVEEPSFPYNNIRKSTFEALEEENRDYSLSLDYTARFAYLLQLNVNAYGRQSLEIKDFGKVIIPG